jgi:hypothetical protein
LGRPLKSKNPTGHRLGSGDAIVIPAIFNKGLTYLLTYLLTGLQLAEISTLPSSIIQAAKEVSNTISRGEKVSGS